MREINRPALRTAAGDRTFGKDRPPRFGWALLPLLILPLLVADLELRASALWHDGAHHRSVDSLDTSIPVGNPRPLDTILHDFGAFFTDGWQVVQRPLHFSGHQWGIAGGMLGTGAVVMAFDEDLNEDMDELEGEAWDGIAKLGNAIGENEIGLLAGAVVYLPGLLFDLPEVRRAGRHVLQTLVYTAAIGSLLKHSLGRSRPYRNVGAYEFAGPWQTSNDFLALPSGHVIVAFSIASSLAADIDNPWATAGLYALASTTAFGRLHTDQHWASDVLFGAIIASVIGHATATSDDPIPSEDEGTSFRLTPTTSGIAASWSW